MVRLIQFVSIVGLHLLAATALDADDTKSALEVRCKRDNDKVEIQFAKDRTLLVIHSPFGISEAAITRKDAGWPEKIMLRLHLAGLEHFHVSAGKRRVDASVSVDKDGVQSRVWKDGKEEAPLKKGDAAWLDVQAIDKDGKAAKVLPNQGGYFEFQLPKALFEGNPPSATISWIDFFRG